MIESQTAEATMSTASPKRIQSCNVIRIRGVVATLGLSLLRKNDASKTNTVVISPSESTHDSVCNPIGRKLSPKPTSTSIAMLKPKLSRSWSGCGRKR